MRKIAMLNLSPTNSDHTIRRILSAWSHTLELDQASGESIVTKPDLDRVISALSEHSDTSASCNSNTSPLSDSDTQ